MSFALPEAALAQLESTVAAALAAGTGADLDILGYGEVTLVLRLPTAAGSFACKRLPRFPSSERFQAYRAGLVEYLDQLAAAGVRAAETQLWHQPHPDGGVVGYCVQRELDTDRLGSRLLGEQSASWRAEFYERFLATVDAAVSPTLGLDAQASNWIDQDGELTYLDVSTPLMRDPRGRERLDVRLFFTSLPWAVRDLVRVTASKSIFDKFYQPRGVVLDFLGNLHKERLSALIPELLVTIADRFGEPITEAEVAAYYRSDARTWEIVQRLRRLDRHWQERVRHRPYPFLLPPAIAR